MKPAVPAETPDSSAADKAIEMYDKNGDKLLDDKELEAVPGLKAAKNEVDTNHDGKISKEEIEERIKKWAESGSGRVPVICVVTHNGEPLAGAKVVFVPEKFLGDAISSGSGATTASGTAMISSEYAADPSVKGISPGFYRVEITKEGDRIPPKYNTETTLGAEAPSTGSFKFDLEY